MSEANSEAQVSNNEFRSELAVSNTQKTELDSSDQTCIENSENVNESITEESNWKSSSQIMNKDRVENLEREESKEQLSINTPVEVESPKILYYNCRRNRKDVAVSLNEERNKTMKEIDDHQEEEKSMYAKEEEKESLGDGNNNSSLDQVEVENEYKKVWQDMFQKALTEKEINFYVNNCNGKMVDSLADLREDLSVMMDRTEKQLVNCKICFNYPSMGCWLSASINQFDEETGKHQLMFQHEPTEWFNLKECLFYIYPIFRVDEKDSKTTADSNSNTGNNSENNNNNTDAASDSNNDAAGNVNNRNENDDNHSETNNNETNNNDGNSEHDTNSIKPTCDMNSPTTETSENSLNSHSEEEREEANIVEKSNDTERALLNDNNLSSTENAVKNDTTNDNDKVHAEGDKGTNVAKPDSQNDNDSESCRNSSDHNESCSNDSSSSNPSDDNKSLVSGFSPNTVRYRRYISELFAIAQGVIHHLYGQKVQELGYRTTGHICIGEIDESLAIQNHSSLLYGEVLPIGLDTIMDKIHFDGPTCKVFTDLGMGTGKLVIQAFIQFPTIQRAVGFEISQSRFAIAEEAVLRLVEYFGDYFYLDKEKYIQGRTVVIKDRNGRSLEMYTTSMFLMCDISLYKSDVIILQTNIMPNSYYSLLRMITFFKRGAKILSYLNFENVWNFEMFPLEQYPINLAMSDRFATSWTSDRGYHFYLWKKNTPQDMMVPPEAIEHALQYLPPKEKRGLNLNKFRVTNNTEVSYDGHSRVVHDGEYHPNDSFPCCCFPQIRITPA
eukprot:g2060.t1